jgi:hypothetical protein
MLLTLFFSAPGIAETARSSPHDTIYLKRLNPAENNGYADKMEYYVPAPIDVFWRFKTDFDNEILLTSKNIIEHRVVGYSANNVITENCYATAPGLRFLWQTTVHWNQYRLDFQLLNAQDCRHDFHFGTIQLAPAGDYTKVTQTACFNFVGASLWVKYPWYGGMKSTLTTLAKWEQKTALRYKLENTVASINRLQHLYRIPEYCEKTAVIMSSI